MPTVLVLGAGRQGLACALDLLADAGVAGVTLADRSHGVLPPALERERGRRLRLLTVDARDARALASAAAGHQAVACALPYVFNEAAARAAVEAGCHYADLGGNTDIVFRQLDLDTPARRRGLSVVPDCGLAPGLVTVLAGEALRRLDQPRSVRLLVGGLPEHPEPPLNYQAVYSLRGVLDYYTTPVLIVRDGRRQTVEALSEVEEIDLGPPLGRLEAFHTAGGASTLPWTCAGRVDRLEYKTLRYPGHADRMRTIRELGLLGTEPVEVDGVRVAPRDVFVATVEPRISRPASPDLVVLRVEAEGTQARAAAGWRWDLLARSDPGTGLSAMTRVTGFSLAITTRLQLEGLMTRSGAATPDEAVPARAYLEALARRGLDVHESALPA